MLADIFGPDLLIVAIVLVVVLFGGAAIPKLARNLGSAKNEFEKGLDKASVVDPVAAADDATKVSKIPTLSHIPSPVIVLDETDRRQDLARLTATRTRASAWSGIGQSAVFTSVRPHS